MEPSNSHEAIWLARGTALGIFLRRLLQALRAGAAGLTTSVALAAGCPKCLRPGSRSSSLGSPRIILLLGRAGASQSRSEDG